MQPSIEHRFEGCLLGLAVGDALGARFEGQSAEWIASRFSEPQSLIDHPPCNELWYTDDTQMMIGVAETLVACGQILEERLCEAFVANYVPSRGYGRGARVVVEAMEGGRDYRHIAETHYPGGSLGNGAAMRVAPVGLFFRDDLSQVWKQARLSAAPTHTHPQGIEGAQLLATAVALASRSDTFDANAFFSQLIDRCESGEYRQRLQLASKIRTCRDLGSLGNGIEAIESVPTAITCFALTPNSYRDVIANAIFLGGDTDTIAAMSGAICGALVGVAGIPLHLLEMLEDNAKGRSYIRELARKLYIRYKG